MKLNPSIVLVAGVLPATLYSASASGQILNESVKLTASDATADDLFGVAVAVSGSTAVVGAYLDDCAAGVNCGAAYAFRFDGTNWDEEQKLTAPDAAASDGFAVSVAVNGTTALVGASDDDGAAGINSGSAYVFRFNGTTWGAEQKLTASDGAANDQFGASVSVSGETVVVGAYLDDRPGCGDECGSAYVFRFNGSNWDEQQKLTASDAATIDWFGCSVSLSGEAVIVGAQLKDCVAGPDCGAAYVYRFNGTSWDEEQKLTASDAAENARFGVSVSISGDVAVVGANRDDDNGADSGTAYVFVRSGGEWTEQQKLTASDGTAGDGFGSSVSISGDAVVVGAESDDDSGSFSGSAYVYRCNGSVWVEELKLLPSDGAENHRFGHSVSVASDMAVVGAHGDDDNGSSSGSAYVFILGQSQVVPAVSAWGGAALTLLFLAVGTIVLQRQRVV